MKEQLDSLSYMKLLDWLEEQKTNSPWTPAMWSRWYTEILHPHDGVPKSDALLGRFQRRSTNPRNRRRIRLSAEQMDSGFDHWHWEWFLRANLPRYTVGVFRNVIKKFQRESSRELAPLVQNPAPGWAYSLRRVTNPRSRFMRAIWAVTGDGVLHDSQVEFVKGFTIRLCNRIKAVLAFRDPMKSDLDGK